MIYAVILPYAVFRLRPMAGWAGGNTHGSGLHSVAARSRFALRQGVTAMAIRLPLGNTWVGAAMGGATPIILNPPDIPLEWRAIAGPDQRGMPLRRSGG
jgi:hypothetical protein